MKKVELVAICKFLLTLYEKDNFSMYVKINEFMFDNIIPLSDEDLMTIFDDEHVPLWVFIYCELVSLVKRYQVIGEKLKKLK